MPKSLLDVSHGRGHCAEFGAIRSNGESERRVFLSPAWQMRAAGITLVDLSIYTRWKKRRGREGGPRCIFRGKGRRMLGGGVVGWGGTPVGSPREVWAACGRRGNSGPTRLLLNDAQQPVPPIKSKKPKETHMSIIAHLSACASKQWSYDMGPASIAPAPPGRRSQRSKEGSA